MRFYNHNNLNWYLSQWQEKPGIEFLDTLSRVMTRGNREKPIVKNDRDQKQYLDKLKN